MGEIKISLLLQRRVICADDGGDGFNVEEEVLVDFGYLGTLGGHCESLYLQGKINIVDVTNK